MAARSVRKQIRDSLLQQLAERLGLRDQSQLKQERPELYDQVESYMLFYDRRRELTAYVTNKGVDDPSDRVEVGSKAYLESTKELRMIAQEMRNALARLKLDPPEEGGGTGGQFLPL